MTNGREEVRALLLQIIQRKIALRAFELYQERGGGTGRELDDWLKAEDEVLGQSISRPLFRSRVS